MSGPLPVALRQREFEMWAHIAETHASAATRAIAASLALMEYRDYRAQFKKQARDT